MAAIYDTSFKELVTHHFVSLLPWLLPGIASCEVVRLSEELPATLRRADLIVRSQGDGLPPTLQMIECQCQSDPDLLLDMLLRAALAHRQYRLLVDTTLLAFTPEAAVNDQYVFGGRGERQSRHCITVRRIYEEPAEEALRLEIRPLLPLVPAMKPVDGDRPALLARVLDRIIDLGDGGGDQSSLLTDAQRRLMLDQAATFATLHLSKLQVQGIVRSVVERRHYMLDPIRDFPWLRAGYEEGMATGMAKSVLAVLAARSIPVDSSLRDRILACHDEALLNQWLTRAATAQTAAEVVGSN
jgi:hypothetical protein